MDNQPATCKCPEGSCGHHSPQVPARYVTTRLGLAEALRQTPPQPLTQPQRGRVAFASALETADALLEYLAPFTATVPPDLRERIGAALDESPDWCGSCKSCMSQLDAVMAVVGPHFERLAEQDNAITWETTCLSCSAVLDSCYRETARAERAEEELSALKAEPAAVPEPVMVLLEDAWNLISDAAQFAPGRPGWDSAADAWRVQYESVVRAHAAAPAREAAGELGRTLTEWCVWYGGEDPNDCAGLLTYDDEEDAAGHAQWFKGGRVASRTVTRGPWQVRS